MAHGWLVVVLPLVLLGGVNLLDEIAASESDVPHVNGRSAPAEDPADVARVVSHAAEPSGTAPDGEKSREVRAGRAEGLPGPPRSLGRGGDGFGQNCGDVGAARARHRNERGDEPDATPHDQAGEGSCESRSSVGDRGEGVCGHGRRQRLGQRLWPAGAVDSRLVARVMVSITAATSRPNQPISATSPWFSAANDTAATTPHTMSSASVASERPVATPTTPATRTDCPTTMAAAGSSAWMVSVVDVSVLVRTALDTAASSRKQARAPTQSPAANDSGTTDSVLATELATSPDELRITTGLVTTSERDSLSDVV